MNIDGSGMDVITYISHFTIQMAAILFWQILTLKLIFQLGKQFFSNSTYSTYDKNTVKPLLTRNANRSFFGRNIPSLYDKYAMMSKYIISDILTYVL